MSRFNPHYNIYAEMIGFKGYRAGLIILSTNIDAHRIVGVIGIYNLVVIAGIVVRAERNSNDYCLCGNVLDLAIPKTDIISYNDIGVTACHRGDISLLFLGYSSHGYIVRLKSYVRGNRRGFAKVDINSGGSVINRLLLLCHRLIRSEVAVSTEFAGVKHNRTLSIFIGSSYDLNVIFAIQNLVATAVANRLVSTVHSILTNVVGEGVAGCGKGCPFLTVVENVRAVFIDEHLIALITLVVSYKSVLGTGRQDCRHGNDIMDTVGDGIIVLNKCRSAKVHHLIYHISVDVYLKLVCKLIAFVGNYTDSNAVIGIFLEYVTKCGIKNVKRIVGFKPEDAVVIAYVGFPTVFEIERVICVRRNLIIRGSLTDNGIGNTDLNPIDYYDWTLKGVRNNKIVFCGRKTACTYYCLITVYGSGYVCRFAIVTVEFAVCFCLHIESYFICTSADKLFVFAKRHAEGIIGDVVPGNAVLLHVIVLIITPIGFLPVTVGNVACAQKRLIEVRIFTCYGCGNTAYINTLNNLTVATEPIIYLHIIVGINCYVFVAGVLKNLGSACRLAVYCSLHHIGLELFIIVEQSVTLVSKTNVYTIGHALLEGFVLTEVDYSLDTVLVYYVAPSDRLDNNIVLSYPNVTVRGRLARNGSGELKDIYVVNIILPRIVPYLKLHIFVVVEGLKNVVLVILAPGSVSGSLAVYISSQSIASFIYVEGKGLVTLVFELDTEHIGFAVKEFVILVNVNYLLYTVNLLEYAPANLTDLNAVCVNRHPEVGGIAYYGCDEILNIHFGDVFGSSKSNGCYSVIGIGSGITCGNIRRLAVYTNRIVRRAVKEMIIIGLDYDHKSVGSARNEGVFCGKYLIRNGILPENAVDVADLIVVAKYTISGYLRAKVGGAAASGAVKRNVNTRHGCFLKRGIGVVNDDVSIALTLILCLCKSVNSTFKVLGIGIKIIAVLCYEMYCRLVYVACVERNVLAVMTEHVTLLTEPLNGCGILTVRINVTVGKTSRNGRGKTSYAYAVHRSAACRCDNYSR